MNTAGNILRRWYLLSPLLFSLLACATTGQGGLQGEFDVARSTWRLARPGDYTYRYQLSCFCPQELTRPVIISVRNARVDSVLYADGSGAVDPQYLSHFRTIDQLFDFMQEALNSSPAEMAASYDPTYGYPTSATIDYDANMADEEFRFIADSLKPAVSR